MTNRDKKRCMLLTLAAALCVSVAAGFTYIPTQKVEAETYDNNTFAMIPGASVRKAERHGIRFGTLIGEDKLAAWKAADANFQMGTIILPENIYEEAGKELTVDFEYTVGSATYLPSIAYYSHTKSVLTEDEDYPDCKIFNAVLELSDISKSDPTFLMQNLVARSFVTLNGVTTYVDEMVIRSAAYVGAAALDSGDADELGVLSSYVQHLESVTLFENKQINVAFGDSLLLDATVEPANVFPVKYTLGEGLEAKGSFAKATTAGKTTLTASVAGGKKSDTVEICVVENQEIEKKYYAEEDVYEHETAYQYDEDGVYVGDSAEKLAHRNGSTAYTAFHAYNVDDVYYNGERLIPNQDYSTSAESGYMEIAVKSAVLVASTKRVNVLKFVSAKSGDVEVDVTTYYEGGEELPESLKGYLNSDLQYSPYAYHSVRDAEMTVASQTSDKTLLPGTSTLTTSARADKNFYTEGYIGDYYDAGLDWALGQSAAGISGFLSQLATSNDYYDATDTFEAYRPTAQNPTAYKDKLQVRSEDLYNTLEIAESLGKTNSVIVTDGVLNDTDRLTIENCYSELSSNSLTLENWDATAPTFFNASVSGSVFAKRQMKSFDHLVAFYTPYVLRYALHPAFGGLLLRDEPKALYMNLVGETYKAVKQIYANIEEGTYTYLNPNDSNQTIQYGTLPVGSYEHFKAADKQIIVNLLPFYPSGTSSFPYVEGTGTEYSNDNANYTAYKAYLECWFRASGADYVQMDIYSLYQSGIYRYHTVNLQMAAEVAKKYNAKITVINSAWRRHSHSSSTFSRSFSGERLHTYEDMQWMNNLTMMYGASNFGYYTYHTLNDNTDQIVEDGASMVTRDGQKTTIYDYVREINAKAQILAPVILNFDYTTGAAYESGFRTSENVLSNGNVYTKTNKYFNNNAQQSFAKLAGVTTSESKYSWLVNELYDSEKGNYMYAVMNTIDTLKGATDYNASKSVSLTFNGGYTHAWVYRDGCFTVMKLTSGKLDLTGMKAGEACYVIPFVEVFDPDYLVNPGDWGDLWS